MGSGVSSGRRINKEYWSYLMSRDLEDTNDQSYQVGQLNERDAGSDPIALFARWLGDAKKYDAAGAKCDDVGDGEPLGKPHARIVLLKDRTSRDFKFYTNYLSHKGRNLRRLPQPRWCFLVGSA